MRLPSDVNIPAKYEQQERDAAIITAVAQLLPEQQKLIREIFFDDIPVVEIARRESVDKSAVSHRLARALKKLEKLVSVK